MAPSNYLDHSIYGMSRYGRYQMQKFLETPYDKIPKNIRELLSTKELDVLKKQARENTDEDVLYFEDNFKLVELKEKAKTNRGIQVFVAHSRNKRGDIQICCWKEIF